MIIELISKHRPQSYQIAEQLFPCTDWDMAEYRYPNPIPEWREKHATACNVKHTGRTIQRHSGAYWIKGEVEWVGDGEPSTFCCCWILVDFNGKEV